VSATAPEVVPAVDLKRYAGRWHEIARLPNRFQRDCAGDVTATYTLRPDGKIAVLNECRAADGRTKSARGTARVASKQGPNTKLKVSFFWPFSGDYWIIGLDPDYRWALVGGSGRDYLWSRRSLTHPRISRPVPVTAWLTDFWTSRSLNMEPHVAVGAAPATRSGG
jgi:apolipoprotein D and lipocalin family protein